MMMKKFALLMILGLLVSFPASAQWVSTYYTNTGPSEPISAIPWQSYTHVILFKVVPGQTGGLGDGTLNYNYQFTNQNITDFVAGAHNAGKKAIVCLGDDFFHTLTMQQATDSSHLATFVTNITNFITANNFDGIDLDWEQGLSGTTVPQYENLISRLHTAMPTKIFSMAVWNDQCCGSYMMRTVVNQIVNLSQVNIMCYDMDQGEGKTEYNDMLTQAGNSGLRACDWAVNGFVTAGVPAAKISVGIPFYGRRWPGSTQVLQTTGVTPSTFYYRDLVTDATRWQPQYRFYDSTYKSDYLSIPSPTEFDSFTGPNTIAAAVAWGKAQGYGGFFTFALNYEYVSSASGNARYPLSTVLYNDVWAAPSPPTGLSLVIQ
jgi:spore germination protein YaaH